MKKNDRGIAITVITVEEWRSATTVVEYCIDNIAVFWGNALIFNSLYNIKIAVAEDYVRQKKINWVTVRYLDLSFFLQVFFKMQDFFTYL